MKEELVEDEQDSATAEHKPVLGEQGPVSPKLQRRVRSKLQKMNTPCRVCGKIVKRAGDMSKHMRTHTGIKPFSCDYCDRRFSQSSSLNTHRRLHTGERPYLCSICHESFGRRDSMIHHHRKHYKHK